MNINENTSFTLEEYTSFSESLLWKFQEEYYKTAGVDAWRRGEVPYYITCNPNIGKAFAEIVIAFLKDLLQERPHTTTVYLLELGAGSGMFCYYFLKQYETILKTFSANTVKLCYVLCDAVQGNLDFWRFHPRMQPYLGDGLLDYALVDTNAPLETIKLEFSGTLIHPQSLDQPLLVIANYFFDSIPTDLFYMDEKQLQKCSLRLQLDEKYRNADLQLMAPNLKFDYKYESVEEPAYREPYLAAILSYYQQNLPNSYVFFPHETLRLLERLKKFSRKGIFLLTADKGYYREEDVPAKSIVNPVEHGGCFSISVNYHALKLYANHAGGSALFPRQPQSSIQVGCLLLFQGHEQYVETRLAYERFINSFSPDDHFNLRVFIEKHIPEMDFKEIMATLRFNGYDANVFRSLYPRLVELLANHTTSERWAVFQAIHKIWDTYYPLGEIANLPFMLAELLFMLSYFPEAITYLNLSIEIYGKQEPVLYNLALTYFILKDFANAKERLVDLLQINPHSENGWALLKKIEELTHDI